MENTNCLTAVEMSTISSVFLECFESELLKQSNKQITVIESFLLEHTTNTKLHTLFTQNGLKTITETVFNNVEVRDFVLCLTDQFNCITALSDLEKRSITQSIGYGLHGSEFSESEYILIPERVYKSMEINGNLISSILQANRWLLTLVLIYLFFQKTRLFNNISQGNTPISK